VRRISSKFKMVAGDSAPENKQVPPKYNIKDLWHRGRFWEIFEFTKGDFTALELTQKYSSLSTTYRNNLDELRLVDDAFATLNAPLTRQFYEGCRLIMQQIRREIGDNKFEQAEIEIWADLWGWVYQRWQEPPEGLINELINRYAQGKTEKRICPNCGENLYYDFGLLLWKCRNPNCRHIYTYRELRDQAIRGKTQEEKRSQPPPQTQPRVTQRGKKRKLWLIPVTIVLTIVVVAIVISIHSRQVPNGQASTTPPSPTPPVESGQVWLDEYTYVAGGNGEPIVLIDNPSANNPTWEQLFSFLQDDQTDAHPYTSTYICADFAETLHNNAEEAGIRTAFVALLGSDHSLNAFETIGKGLIYIDCSKSPATSPTVIRGEYGTTIQFDVVSSWDKVAYVQVDKPLGFISLKNARSYGFQYSSYERWTRDKELFDQLLDIPGPGGGHFYEPSFYVALINDLERYANKLGGFWEQGDVVKEIEIIWDVE
jgi:hypothetical protein